MPKRSHHVVICLANLMDRNGQLNEESEGRLQLACEIARAQGVPLITTGWDYRADSIFQIALAMRDRAVGYYGLSTDQVMVEATSRDTVGDALFTKRHVVANRPWSRIHIVSSDYHIPRALKIFQFIYGPNYVATATGSQTVVGMDLELSEQASLAAFATTFEGIAPGDDLAMLKRLYERHPFYMNGALPKLSH